MSKRADEARLVLAQEFLKEYFDTEDYDFREFMDVPLAKFNKTELLQIIHWIADGGEL